MKHRRGIFIKVFVWFWAVTIVVIAITISIDRLTGYTPRERHMFRSMEILLAAGGRLAAAHLAENDQEGLTRTLQLIKSSTGLDSFLFSEDGMELQNKTVPWEMTAWIARIRSDNRPRFTTDSDKVIGALFFEGKDRKRYLLAGWVPLNLFAPTGEDLWFLVQRLAVALVISCLACYLLARYLTAPIIRLGEASRRLAAGDLKTRISPAEGKRWDEIGELAHDFDLMAKRISSLITSQQQLLANISHELRSPLARLNVALELVRRSSTPENEKYLRRMEWEAERLNELIGRLLSFSRLESGLGEIKEETIDLSSLLQEIVDDADFEARGRNRAVKLEKSEPCLMTGEGRMVRSAIENVIRNAVLYTPEGTAVTVSLERRIQADRFWAILQVRDFGPGVPEEALADLFRPFYRLGRTGDRRGDGIGLGLAITRKAVQLHGGSVEAWNAVDGGLIVEIKLPLLSAKSS